MRVAVYARYSTDSQDPLSIETQLDHCRREFQKHGWTETHTFSDAAQSAATMHRPQMRALLAVCQRRDVDIVYADALDRLSRSQGDIATFFEKLKFLDIQLVTRKEGVVTTLHIGMMGTINAEQLNTTRVKTRDALRKRVHMGRSAGGIAFGYRKMIRHDANGERIKGLLEVDPLQAPVVIRVLEEYAAGCSPDAIAKRLNREGIPAPRPRKAQHASGAKPVMWSANTITGNIKRGTGLLNNVLYIGLRTYERLEYRKNPDTGKRHSFLNTVEQQQPPMPVPELRVVSDELWNAVKARQALLSGQRETPPKPTGTSSPIPFYGQQRPKFLLSGKMTCGACGASYAKSGKSRFGCQGHGKKGDAWCTNNLTIRQDDLDHRVLAGLTNEMMREEVLAAFIDEFECEYARLTEQKDPGAQARDLELAEINEQIQRIKTSVVAGFDASVFVEEMKALNHRKSVLLEQSSPAPPLPAIALSLDLAEIYREKVSKLTEAFEDISLQTQAFERIRALIDHVTLTPEDGALTVSLRGELASILDMCVDGERKKPPEASASEALQIEMVAGAGFEPATFRL